MPHAARRAGSLPARRPSSNAPFPASISLVRLMAQSAPIPGCASGTIFLRPQRLRLARSLNHDYEIRFSATAKTRADRMKHFLSEGEHIVPFEKRAPELIAAHRQFLQQGYDAGRFLLSGPSIPPKGGILIARARSLEELKKFLANEPYCKAKVMRFSKITEFNPVQHQPILKDWFEKPQS
jgi:uncharacterized protein YciI